MVKKSTKVRLYDGVQKVWVSTCLAISIVTFVGIGFQMYNYFTKIKPMQKELEEKFKEDLLKEGRLLRNASVYAETN